ncbi:hypothetical protein QYE76_058085 [Lolium multiflorum]|uniref:Bidirectional sugar transporter SWEET n=1 Tax=Lolium multiflorum TaxID=4521 RepID=A0AAD8WPN5_LOLMU|nr:hypothetical protein QYE76_058085 [Lolium multiflorum]
MGILRDVAGGLGNFFAGILIAALLITMYQIWRDNSVGQRWVVNYVATFVNAVCMVAPSKRYRLVAIINCVGVVAEFGYSCFFRQYAQGRARRVTSWEIAVEVVWGAAVLIGYFSAFNGGRHDDLRVQIFGILAAVTTGAMYIAMLPDTWAVFRTHVRQNQNVLLLLAALGNCVSWTLFSIKPRDLYIQVPNGAGIGLTAIQTLVWVVIWRMYPNAVPQQPPANNGQANQSQVNIELPSPA